MIVTHACSLPAELEKQVVSLKEQLDAFEGKQKDAEKEQELLLDEVTSKRRNDRPSGFCFLLLTIVTY